jgi:L-lactate dehydrogenase complex protein LldG
MSNREPFLARVRQAAEQGRQYRVHVQDLPADIGYVGAGTDLAQRFVEEVTAVGGQTFVVGSVDGARAKLGELLSEAKAASAVCWQHELLERVGLKGVLVDLKVEGFDFDRLVGLTAEERRQKLLACDLGITGCDCAIAETGTLMMCAGPGQERLASLIAPMHIAVVERRQIVADLIDAFRLLHERGLEALPSNATFITGPSKTGDIELQLTTGVHGPGVWQVIVIDEAAA